MSFLDTGSVPNGKSYLYPLPSNADPTRYLTPTEWNQLCQDLVDLRAGLIAALTLAFTPSATRPATYANGGQAQRFWVRSSDNHLMFFDGTADYDFTPGFLTPTAPGAYPYTVAAGVTQVAVDSSANRTILLPSANQPGRRIEVVDAANQAGTHNITVTAAGTDTINGGAGGGSLTVNSNSGLRVFINIAAGKWVAF